MKYIDAGYISALSALFVYGVVLLGRRRRLERAAQPSLISAAAPGRRSPAP